MSQHSEYTSECHAWLLISLENQHLYIFLIMRESYFSSSTFGYDYHFCANISCFNIKPLEFKLTS